MPVAEGDDPSKCSSDYDYCSHYWKIVSDILAGVEAMRANAIESGRIGGNPIAFLNQTTQQFAQARVEEIQSPYLPRLPNEPWNEYERRRRNAFLTNVYSDISNNLSSKPFSKDCSLNDKTPDDIKKIAENIDGLGNNLHVFAADVFKTAMDKGITWILSEFTKVPAGATLADERNLGARPYWVHIKPEKLIAVYSKFLKGQEVIFHARIDEPCTELNGYNEETYKRVRVMEREPVVNELGEIIDFGAATWALYQENTDRDPKTGKDVTTWDIIDFGVISIGVIPLIPLILGKRDGTSWRVQPPLCDLGYMQVKLFQMESNLDYTKELTAFPMLAGDGIAGTIPGQDGTSTPLVVPVGPRAVLFAPPDGNGKAGSWKFIEPAGGSLTFLQKDIDSHKMEMRDLGMQPLSAANLTVVTTANLSLKASNAVQAWALKLKDMLEQTWKITGLWTSDKTEPEVVVFTDFGVKIEGTDIADIAAAQTDGVISKHLRFDEMKRRGVLMEEADWDKDEEEKAKEQSNQVLTPEKLIDPVTGHPMVVQPKVGNLNPPPKPPIKVRPGEKVVTP